MTTEQKIYNSMLLLLKKKEKLSIANIAKEAHIDRSALYYRINRIGLHHV